MRWSIVSNRTLLRSDTYKHYYYFVLVLLLIIASRLLSILIFIALSRVCRFHILLHFLTLLLLFRACCLLISLLVFVSSPLGIVDFNYLSLLAFFLASHSFDIICFISFFSLEMNLLSCLRNVREIEITKIFLFWFWNC